MIPFKKSLRYQEIGQDEKYVSFKESNIFARWSYSFIDVFLNKAEKEDVKIENYPPVEQDDDVSLLSEKILKEWDLQVALNGQGAKLLKALVFLF
jgi:hypothetical protein